MLERVTSAMLEARAALWRKFEQLHREMLRIVRDDEICRRHTSARQTAASILLSGTR
jgi:hypothetical protein